MTMNANAYRYTFDSAQPVSVVWERVGSCLWHVNCQNHLGGVMCEEDAKVTHSLLRCLHCGVSAWVPHGLHDGRPVSVPAVADFATMAAAPSATLSAPTSAGGGDAREILSQHLEAHGYRHGAAAIREGRDSEYDRAVLSAIAAALASQPKAEVSHDVAMESWHSAVDDASELFTNAPDQRFASRASRVVTWIKAHKPTAALQVARHEGEE